LPLVAASPVLSRTTVPGKGWPEMLSVTMPFITDLSVGGWVGFLLHPPAVRASKQSPTLIIIFMASFLKRS
jgi:hypothetical protein